MPTLTSSMMQRLTKKPDSHLVGEEMSYFMEFDGSINMPT
jgi:hypothetical protein